MLDRPTPNADSGDSSGASLVRHAIVGSSRNRYGKPWAVHLALTFASNVLAIRLKENPSIVKLANSRVLMKPGARPSPDKPDISVINYERGRTVSSFMNPPARCTEPVSGL
jgi:hypothetical protein